ncbi:MAG: hypothetical protein LWW85_05720 [Marinilabiliales bacterium]|nr:hypothetical protein [Marinilabiliales bacterium]
MSAMIYWIDHIANCRIGITPRPPGFGQLENEVIEFKSQHVNFILSLLEDHEIEQFGLIKEEFFCEKYKIGFDNLPIKDHLIPGFQRFADKIDNLSLEMPNLENFVVHCNHGLGRSGLFVAGLLLKSGKKLVDVLKILEVNRGFKCPTSTSQLKFLKAYDDFLNGPT